MPRRKNKEVKEINYENNQALINKLLKGVEDKKYIIINYVWLYDYYKVLSMASKEFSFRYNPLLQETKGFIELSSFNEVFVVAKIPIVHTNIDKEILLKIKHIAPSSKYHDNLFVFVFDENFVSFRYSYNNKLKILNTNNDKYCSLYSLSKKNIEEYEDDVDTTSGEEDDDEDDEYVINNSDTETDLVPSNKNGDGLLNISFLAEEEIEISQEACYKNIENDLIKNVICYASIEFDHLKEVFNKFGNTRLQITIKGDTMKFKTLSPSINKRTIITLNVLNINKKYYEKEIVFFINTKSILKFKSLGFNFSIMPHDDKKMFKIVEFKIIYQERGNAYGITMFPGNFDSLKQTKVNDFDLYNSLMIFIPALEN